MNLFKKKKGIGITGTIFVLGIVAFAMVVVIPKVAGKGNLTNQKNIQAQADVILKDAKRNINASDLQALGVTSTQDLTAEVFNSLEVVNVLNFLNLRGVLKGFKADSILINNPNITLGDLKVLTNVPAKDIIVDGNGYLVKEPYIVQK
ncbi:MAG: hypothetical protein ACRCWG_01550 [Sarcina sp.]